MGKLILCAGKKAKKPYWMPLGNVRLYTVEELCYYLYHNIYAVKEDMFCPELIEWVREELELPKLAEKLEVLAEQNYSMKDRIVTIFCNCDYYSEKEVRRVVGLLEKLELLSDEQKACMKADNYLQYGKYAKAASIYELLIGNQKIFKKLSEKDKGRVYHNLAVSYINIASYTEAADCFEQAYIIGKDEESLKQYLFAVKLGGMKERYENALLTYEVSDEKKRHYERELGRCMMDLDDYEEARAVQKLRNLRQQGRVGDYYEGIDTVIAHWKDQYLMENEG